MKYKFNYILNEEDGFDPVPVVESPPVYSRRIQKTERGYHFPLSDSEEWLHAVLPIDTPKNVIKTHLGTHSTTTLDGETITLGVRKGSSQMLLTFLQKQLRKLNGISSHLKRKRKEEEKKTNGDKKRKRDEDDEDRSTYELDTTRFRESIARKILENFDGLTKSTMEKIETVFRERLFWDLRNNVSISDKVVTEDMLRQVLQNRHKWLFGRALTEKQQRKMMKKKRRRS